MRHLLIIFSINSVYWAEHPLPGAGQVDGEILETLWAVLNLIHNSICRMAESHWRETFDDHMNDPSWKRILRMGELMLIN
jgi:hypothetical protein